MIAIIDHGNTNIKIAIFDHNQIICFKKIENKESIPNNELSFLNQYSISKTYIGSSCKNKMSHFLILLENIISCPIFVFENVFFKKYFNFININIDEVGIDVLSLALYIKNKFVKGVGFSLGTAYFCIAIENDDIHGATIAPSVRRSMNSILTSTEAINYIPNIFNKKIGFNTIDSLSAGAHNMINGYIMYNLFFLKNIFIFKDVVITGGDLFDVDLKSDDSYKFHYQEDAIIFGYKFLIDKGDF